MHRNKNVLLEVLRFSSPLLILTLGIGGLFLFFQPPEDKQLNPTPDTASVRTERAAKFEDAFTIEVEGAAVPFRRVTLSAEVAGRIVSKSQRARAGGFVNQGDVLFQIDPTDYDLEIERLEAQRLQAEAEIEEVDTDLGNTQGLIQLAQEDVRLQQRNLARSKRLITSNTASDTELDQARMSELKSRNALQTLRNQTASLNKRKARLEAALKLVNVQLKQARVKRKRTLITSPITGTVVVDEAEENDYVMIGAPLIHFTETDKIEVKCSLRVDEMYWIWLQSGLFGNQTSAVEARYQIPPTPVDVVFNFQDVEYVWDGKLSRYEGTGLDEQTRTVPCRVLVAEPTKVRIQNAPRDAPAAAIPALYSGMYVTIRIEIKPPIPLLKIPLSALQPRGQVWAVRKEELRILPVNVARVEDEFALIRSSSKSSLLTGDRVVTSPLAAVKDGMPVKEAN